jgi:low temperature requirement protein LtrA
MLPRDPAEPHRVSSTLELFFDLTFAVAIGVVSEQLAVLLGSGAVASGTFAYLFVFFGIWWAWMNFTWFASAFATDDWLYRVLTIVQMAGVLIFAAGAAAAMDRFDFRIGTIGYVLMRLAVITLWLRAAYNGREFRATALRYALGVSIVQVAWLLRLLVPPALTVPSFAVLVIAELAVPIWAEQTRVTPFHPRHIAERYGLFTLIVLGEGLVAITHATIAALQDASHIGPLLLIAASALVLVAGMWWIYFARDQHDNLTSLPSTFGFGYLHYAIFAAAGALAAGIEVALEQAGDHPTLPAALGRATTTVPVAVFLLCVWVLALRPALPRRTSAAVLVLTVAVALAAFVPAGLPISALLVVAIVVVLEMDWRHHSNRESAVASAEAID